MKKIAPLLLLAPALASCGAAGRLAAVGKPPRMTAPDDVPAPPWERSIASSGAAARRAAAEDPSLPPAPPPPAPAQSASLFRAGAGSLFRDQRASAAGDILTIRINVADKATVDNSTERSRSGSEKAGIASLLGVEKLIQDVLPGQPDMGAVVDGQSTSRSAGNGNTSRSETISLTMSAVVTNVLPNGNLVIRGRQEIRVNFELRELVLTGIIRPQDIGRDNSIRHTQIAEARISYGGRGQLTDVQQARWAQQVYDALFPF
jgi:flagellar L-ring protein precursor FlgH